MLIGSYTFVDLRERAIAHFKTQLEDSKRINGATKSAHIEHAVKQDIAAGMTEEAARIKWNARPKTITPDNDVIYCYNLYSKLMDCREYGMDGLLPLNLRNIKLYEDRYAPISEPILMILMDLDNAYYSNKD